MNADERKRRSEKAKLERLRYKLNGPTVRRVEKRCSHCKQVKPADQFNVNKGAADWLSTRCKPCAVAVSAEWRKKNPERATAHSRAQWERDRLKPDDERLKYSRRYYQRNKKVQSERTQRWKKKNRQKFNAYMLRYHKEKYKRDPNYRFAVKIRSKIRLLMRGHRKSATTEQLLGCSISEFKRYLELQWEHWMSWGNYGNDKGCWVIDHIVPVEAFDLSKPDDQRCCFHFSNMRPLCREKNREKWHTANPSDLEALRSRINELNQRNKL